MKIPVHIEITDVTPQRHDSPDNRVQVQVLEQSSRLPFFQFECSRSELRRAVDKAFYDGHLLKSSFEATLTTRNK